MKKLIVYLGGIILLSLSLLARGNTDNPKKYAVALKEVPIHAEPSIHSEILFTVLPGEKMLILEDELLWLKVKAKYGVGYVKASLVKVEIERTIDRVPENPSRLKSQTSPLSGVKPTVSRKHSRLPFYIAGGLAVAGATAFILFRKGGILNPGTATLRVNSVPSQANFYIDGQKKCTTPCTVENVSPGKHQLKVVKEFYGEWSKEMELKGYQEYNIEATLSPYGYEPDFCFGSSGQGNGQFDWPMYITVDDQDKLYVTDYRNKRVQKFDLNGNFLGKIDLGCNADGIKFSPITTKIYVSSYCVPNDLISLTRNLIIWTSKNLGNGIKFGIGIDKDGNLYVSDNSYNKIVITDLYGNYKSEFSTGTGSRPTDVGYGNEELYVALSGSNRVAIYSTSGSKQGEFLELYAPMGVAVDKWGYVYVAAGGSKIYKFTSDGEEILHFGQVGSGKGNFNWPMGIVALDDGTLIIVDSQNDRVCEWRLSDETVSSASARISIKRKKNSHIHSFHKALSTEHSSNIYHLRAHKIRK